MLAAIVATEGVGETYGTLQPITTAVITEVAVAFATAPTASGSTDSVTITGATDVAGYVVCWMEK